MNISFENQVALVTGAASGLGLATAKAFAESGASVVLADWNQKEVQAAAKEIAGNVRDKAVAGAKVADQTVRENPYQAIAIGVGVGMVAGYLLSRRCSRDRD